MRLQKTMMGLSACTSCIVYSERGYYSIKFLLLSSFLQYPILSLSSAELYFMVSRISGMPTAYVRTPSFFPMSCQWCKSPWWFPSTLQSWWVLNAMFGSDTLADSRIALTWLMITSNTISWPLSLLPASFMSQSSLSCMLKKRELEWILKSIVIPFWTHLKSTWLHGKVHIVWKLLKMSHLNFGIFHQFLSY